MDPQQRLMLELAWEALEDAGIAARPRCGRADGRVRRRDRRATTRPAAGARRSRDRPARHHRQPDAQHHRQPGLLLPRPARAEPGRGHRRSRRRSSPSTWPARACARGEIDDGAGRRREPQPRAGQRRRAGRARRAVARTAAASPSTRGRTASCAARAAAWWCSSRWTRAVADGDRDLRRDPRQRRQQRRRRRRAHRAQIHAAQERGAADAPTRGRASSRPRSSTSSCTAPARALGDPSRGDRARRGARARPRRRAAAPRRLGEDQHRAPGGGGGHRRADQGRALRSIAGELPPSLNFERPNPADPPG